MEIKTNGFKLPSGDIHVFIPPEPTETDRGGIKASEKTTESLEVKYDKKTGKLFSPTSPTDNTLTKSNVAADAKKTGDEFARVNNNMESKLNKQQGVENKGKALVVGEDGNVVVGEVQSSGNTDIIKALQDALISKVVNGESINVSDSSRLPVEEFSMSGKLEQVQTTGAQLFDLSKSTIGVAIDKTNGLEVTYGKSWISSDYIAIRGNTRYSVNAIENNLNTGFAFYREDRTFISGIACQKSFQTPQDAKYVRLTVFNADNISETFMFNEGETAKPYEPYTGGKPSPSPDYSQPIETTPQGVITVDFTDGTNHQVIELNCPREFTKWDRLEKIDGVWNWVFQSKRDSLKSFTQKGSDENLDGTIFNRYESNISVGEFSESAEEILCTNLQRNTVGDIYFAVLGSGKVFIYFDSKLEINTLEKARTWINSHPDIEFVFKDSSKEPELIPLSPSEQDKLNTLTMYAPNTEITNTGGCNMELTYTVDTKSYVDSKIASVVKSVVETQKALL